jgi:hypothetical protein
MATEEMSELTTCLCHLIRDRIKPSNDHLAEEIADVELVIEQLKDMLNNWVTVDKWKDAKMARLEERLKEDKRIDF